MASRWGPGPVLGYEWLMATRGWQVHGGRMLFVGILRLATPAATAGVICQEKARENLPLLLIVSVTTALVEERVRGSLDVLLTTPLSSRSLVLAKWWSVYRRVPWLLFLPMMVAWRFRPGSRVWDGGSRSRSASSPWWACCWRSWRPSSAASDGSRKEAHAPELIVNLAASRSGIRLSRPRPTRGPGRAARTRPRR